ncbi:hypothetical protein TYRP_019869 [Tyrophagus putrescentiae]|nr:hypothetical protein TYRP_019869 [Tyrophagus putrescentiae]
MCFKFWKTKAPAKRSAYKVLKKETPDAVDTEVIRCLIHEVASGLSEMNQHVAEFNVNFIWLCAEKQVFLDELTKTIDKKPE